MSDATNACAGVSRALKNQGIPTASNATWHKGKGETVMPNTLDFSQHPCFNSENRHKFMRVHLPVAPRCNVQCNFCTRRFDCVNETRPGVTSAVLSPKQSVWYLEQMVAAHPQIAVVGIAGPGDPFANADETLETLHQVRQKFPRLLLCLATNGLQLLPYIPQLAELQVSHVSITVNAVDEAIAEKIYPWVRYGKRTLTGHEGVSVLLRNQLAAIPELKAHGVIVKINTVVIADVNADHVEEIARKVRSLGADIFNPMPMYANSQAEFGAEHVPEAEKIRRLKSRVGEILPVMSHCARCRADAIGFLGAPEQEADQKVLQQAARLESNGAFLPPAAIERKYVAVASREGLLINQHLGEAQTVWVYAASGQGIQLLEKRSAPPAGTGDQRWEQLGGMLKDCSHLLVSGLGPRPKNILNASGLQAEIVEGMIAEIVPKVLSRGNIKPYCVARRACGEACNGNGGGCG